MKVALVNPPWSFEGSIYFGCREPHLPLELGYAQALLQAAGHEAALVDAHLEGLALPALRRRVEELAPDMIVVTTAPSYLFWRCPPPELRGPKQALAALAGLPGARVVVGPHGSTSPETTLEKLDADVVVRGECEGVVAALASTAKSAWGDVPGIALRAPDGGVRVTGGPQAAALEQLPPLAWPSALLERHQHHHHRFDRAPTRPGAEVEWSRGCPFRCTFCAKETHRDRYRKRPLAHVLAEIDALCAQGVEYVYFIDEIFLPDAALLAALTERPIEFGVQTRVDLWSLEELDALGRAGCVTVEAGVESISQEGRARLDKRCRLDTDALTERLVRARQSIPFVQATLMESKSDDPAAVAAWRDELRAAGVWANEPVPLFAYPGSPDYRRLWGEPDEQAWERAHAHYLGAYEHFSDVQEQRFVRLPLLEQIDEVGVGARGRG
jgi:anaerobic magnesium-protoporphyrin IX monomethyl ester cyclase